MAREHGSSFSVRLQFATPFRDNFPLRKAVDTPFPMESQESDPLFRGRRVIAPQHRDPPRDNVRICKLGGDRLRDRPKIQATHPKVVLIR
jgi:hypothetical protein